jgi:hypothetical protein
MCNPILSMGRSQLTAVGKWSWGKDSKNMQWFKFKYSRDP